LKSNKKLLNDLGTGTTFKELSTVALCNINIPLPPLAAQKQIVQKLDAAFEKISKLKSLYEDKLNKVIDLRKSILQREFEN
jgi:type I restriction enzyme S subunit